MNAVIYARYSSNSQREESIEGQLRECHEYADRHDLTIVGEYIDRALPLLKKQLKEVEKGVDNMLDAIQQGILKAKSTGVKSLTFL